MLAASIVLFVAADLVAGPLRFAAPARGASRHRRLPERFACFDFTWRAVGWRAARATANAGARARRGVVLHAKQRAWSAPTLGLRRATVEHHRDRAVHRRASATSSCRDDPSWPWIRSLPWSSAARAVDDAIAIGAPAIGIALASGIVDLRTIIVCAGDAATARGARGRCCFTARAGA